MSSKRKVYKIEIIEHWNGSFLGGENVLMTFNHDEIFKMSVDPMSIMAFDFFMRKPRKASFSLPYTSEIKTQVEESTRIGGTLYFDEYGTLLLEDTVLLNYKEKTELITGLSEIFVKIYEEKNSSFEEIFVGTIDLSNSSFGDGGKECSIIAYDTLRIVNDVSKKLKFIPTITSEDKYFEVSSVDLMTSLRKIVTEYLNINIDFDINGFVSSYQELHSGKLNSSTSFIKSAFEYDRASGEDDYIFSQVGTVADTNNPVKPFYSMFRSTWEPYSDTSTSSHFADSGDPNRPSNIDDFMDKFFGEEGDSSGALSFLKKVIIGNDNIYNPINQGAIPVGATHDYASFFAPIYNRQAEPNDPAFYLPNMQYVYSVLWTTKRGELGETISTKFMRCVPVFTMSITRTQDEASYSIFSIDYAIGYIWLDNSVTTNTVVLTKIDSDINPYSLQETAIGRIFFEFNKSTEEFEFLNNGEETEYEEARASIKKALSRAFFPEKDVGTKIRTGGKLYVATSSSDRSTIEEFEEDQIYQAYYEKRGFSDLIRFLSFVKKEKWLCNEEGKIKNNPVDFSGTPIFTITKYETYNSKKKKNTLNENLAALDPWYIGDTDGKTEKEIDQMISDWNNNYKQPLLEDYGILFDGDYSRESTITTLNRDGNDLSLLGIGEIIELDIYTGMFKDIHVNGKLYIMEYKLDDTITITGLFKSY